MQDVPKKYNSDAIIVPYVENPSDVEITSPKSVITADLIETTESIATVTKESTTLIVETTTEDEYDEDGDDEYALPEDDSLKDHYLMNGQLLVG